MQNANLALRRAEVPGNAEGGTQTADTATRRRHLRGAFCMLNSAYFNASSAFTTSSSPVAISFALPGSSGRLA